MVEAGESEYSGLLKTRNLLKDRHAQYALASEIALNWNVSGTPDFQPACHVYFSGNYVILVCPEGPSLSLRGARPNAVQICPGK